MQEKVQQRLQQLKHEYENGQRMLADLEAKQFNLRETLLRINGAIQVLEEVLEEDSTPVGNGKPCVESGSVKIKDFNYHDASKHSPSQ